MGYRRNQIPSSIHGYGGKTESPAQHPGTQNERRRLGHLYSPVPTSRKKSWIRSRRRSNPRRIPKSVALQTSGKLRPIQSSSNVERLDPSGKTPSARVYLPQGKSQGRRKKRRSNKIPVEERAQQKPECHGHRMHQGLRHIYGCGKMAEDSKRTLLPMQPKGTHRQILSQTRSKSRGSIHI